jgi:phosphoserine phosphatase
MFALKKVLKLLNIAEILTKAIFKEKGIYSNLDAMGTYSIIWDFDGTLLPNDPYDIEQSLMLYKLHETGNKIPSYFRAMAHILIYADNKEHLRKTFKRFYVRFMRGVHATALDRVSEYLAAKISAADRKAIRMLKQQAQQMIVLSCGTADLCERVLKMAGIDDSFDVIEGNRFTFEDNRITGMTYAMKNPEDKMVFLQNNGFSPGNTIAVGDGYTDIPMLDWARISILLDRSGQKKAQFRHKKYHFISSIPEILELINPP